jgi:hypothetical protein
MASVILLKMPAGRIGEGYDVVEIAARLLIGLAPAQGSVTG